ncbi:MAG: GNAT family N-acetyltransferase [Candidatus Hydrogenedentes bacterium]|nr:GNAT family N-acetyltransferase [Candidatus Hydrogenedentota bacterium]
MEITVREYRPEDADEWMRVHAIILSISHAWNYSIQERPVYERESTQLVAVGDGKIIGLTDTEYDRQCGDICFLKDSRGGYVLEFGRLPEYKGLGIGKLLIDATVEDAKKKGIRRLEYWSQDRRAQRFYARLGMKEIGRHYRFRMKSPNEVSELLNKDYIGIEYIYCACLPDEWPLIKEKYEVIQRAPLEPHLCIGYEIRF